jgi:hypothetical protein
MSSSASAAGAIGDDRALQAGPFSAVRHGFQIRTTTTDLGD